MYTQLKTRKTSEEKNSTESKKKTLAKKINLESLLKSLTKFFKGKPIREALSRQLSVYEILIFRAVISRKYGDHFRLIKLDPSLLKDYYESRCRKRDSLQIDHTLKVAVRWLRKYFENNLYYLSMNDHFGSVKLIEIYQNLNHFFQMHYFPQRMMQLDLFEHQSTKKSTRKTSKDKKPKLNLTDFSTKTKRNAFINLANSSEEFKRDFKSLVGLMDSEDGPDQVIVYSMMDTKEKLDRKIRGYEKVLQCAEDPEQAILEILSDILHNSKSKLPWTRKEEEQALEHTQKFLNEFLKS